MSECADPVPQVAQFVHYVSYGTPGGEYRSVCRAAVVTEVHADGRIAACVLNPTGLFFHESLWHDEGQSAGTWHYCCPF